MPKRRVVVLQNEEAWNNFLIEAFDDTPSTPEIVRTAQEALPLIRQGNPEVVFANPTLLNSLLVAALRTNRASKDEFRAFRLGLLSETTRAYASDLFDEGFEAIPESLYEFHKRLVPHLPLPDPIRILVADDEPEVGEIFRDYFDHRTGPAFLVETVQDGLEAEKRIEANPPHVLVLDVKMPGKDGRDLYRELRQKGKSLPTIIFFDLVSSDEVLEIRKWGSPAFVEKGSHASAMPEMASLIKKLAYFG